MTDTNVSQIELESYEKKNCGATCQIHHAPIKLCTRLSCHTYFVLQVMKYRVGA